MMLYNLQYDELDVLGVVLQSKTHQIQSYRNPLIVCLLLPSFAKASSLFIERSEERRSLRWIFIKTYGT